MKADFAFFSEIHLCDETVFQVDCFVCVLTGRGKKVAIKYIFDSSMNRGSLKITKFFRHPITIIKYLVALRQTTGNTCKAQKLSECGAA